MNRSIVCALFLALSVSAAAAQKTGAGGAPKNKASAGFIGKVLKFLGIADNPSTLRGPGDEVVTGNVWLADLESKTTRALTKAGGYRSPVFVCGSSDVIALRGADVVRIPSKGGEGKRLYTVAGIDKLVGCDPEEPATVLILLQGGADGRPKVGLLTISSGATAPLPYDSSSRQDLEMVGSLQAWTRTYGQQEVYVESQSKQAFSGTVEWVDVFLKAGNARPVNVSQCGGTNCGQPSLSRDKRLVAFVKAQDE